MPNVNLSVGGEPGYMVIALVALLAGLLRGFTGFGGPALMLIILTMFFSPISIVPKVLIVDFISGVYLFHSCFRQINWRNTALLVTPSLLFIPLGHWLLLAMEPQFSRRIIAITITLACVAMLVGYRYRRPMSAPVLMVIGAISGLVFGGTYIALLVVVPILLGPYSSREGRTLIIGWAFFSTLFFALVYVLSGTITWEDVGVSLPGTMIYLLGTWVGSLGFRRSSEKVFRRVAMVLLMVLSLLNLLA